MFYESDSAILTRLSTSAAVPAPAEGFANMLKST